MGQLLSTSENRFDFGNNWLEFISNISEENIREAEESLKKFLDLSTLTNLSFLDIGSGSGLLSLAAHRLGAKIHAFDYDPESVICTEKMKELYSSGAPEWVIERGSILDKDFVLGLGKYDISYAWGVLHHTGALWQALYNAHLTVKPGGLLFIGIYNDQGLISALWKIVKRTYCAGRLGRALMMAIFYPMFFLSGLFIDLIKFRNPLKRYSNHKKYRGMSLLIDWRDWLGGYPYEPASPDEVVRYFENLDYQLVRLQKTEHGFGNNQFLFRKSFPSRSA